MANSKTLPADFCVQPYIAAPRQLPELEGPHYDISSCTMSVVVPEAKGGSPGREELRLRVRPRVLTPSRMVFVCSEHLRRGWRVYCFLNRSDGDPGTTSRSPGTFLLVGWVTFCRQAGLEQRVTLQLDPACKDSLRSFHYHDPAAG